LHGGDIEKINIPIVPLELILEKNGLSKIDYLSIDIEGGEYNVLKDFDFRKYSIEVVSVENNYNSLDLHRLLINKGYHLFYKIGADDIYVLNSSDFGKINLTAIVVNYNEGAKIEECLNSISFCKDIVVFDLGSNDNSLQLLNRLDVQIVHHDRVNVVEELYVNLHKLVDIKSNWVMFLDPDEVVSDGLRRNLINLWVNGISLENIDAINVPWIFYFKRRKLLGTHWGGINRKTIIYDSRKLEFQPFVHRGKLLEDKTKILYLEYEADVCLKHFWVDSIFGMMEKHLRYIKKEGESRYYSGNTVSLVEILTNFPKDFYESFVVRKGFKDKLLGFYLGLFWAFYQGLSQFSLWWYLRKHKTRIPAN